MPELPVLKSLPEVEQVRTALDEFLVGVTKYRSLSETPTRTHIVNMRSFFLLKSEWDEFRNSLKGVPNLVGIGRDRMVIDHPHNPNKVVSVYHRPQDWYFMAEAMYLHRALNVLFPKNFPQPSNFFGFNDEYEHTKDKKPEGFFPTGFVVERIRGTKGADIKWTEGFMSEREYDPDNFRVFYDAYGVPLVKYPFQEVLRISERLGLPIGLLGFDPVADNFILGEDGAEYYVDMLTGPYYSPCRIEYTEWWSSAKILKNIEAERRAGKINIDDQQMARVSRELGSLG